MGILTLLLFLIIAVSLFNLVLITREDYKDLSLARNRLKYIKTIGILAIIIGFLGQMIGLFDAFKVIEYTGSISPGILAGGLKISLITPIYGAIIFLISYIFWISLDLMVSRKLKT